MIKKKHIENFDWIILLTVIAISTCGLSTIYSVTSEDPPPNDFQKQLIFSSLGIAAMFFFAFLDYRIWIKISPFLYLTALLLLIYLLVFGRTELGVRRWIALPGGLKFQPSELAKITTVLMLAQRLTKIKNRIPRLLDMIVPGLIAGIPLVLILLEPDLGTSLLIIPLFGAFVFISGYNLKRLAVIAAAGIVLAGFTGPKIMKPYQWKRITGFLNPEADPLGAGYHLIQSKTAIGSGGLLGKGLKSGTQSQLNFLPVQDTDFIFAVWGEERGFAGAALLIGLYALLLFRLLQASKHAIDIVPAFVCIGFTVILFCQVVINTGMVIGLMPITGLPLPFMSYGGSATLINFSLIGVVLSISMRRFHDYSD